MVRHLERHATETPDHAAVCYYDTDLSYSEIYEKASRFAGWLASNGVLPGSRVGIQLPNCPQYVISFLGTLMAGAVCVPINTMYTAKETRHQLQDAVVEALVTLDGLAEVATIAARGTAVRLWAITTVSDEGHVDRDLADAVTGYKPVGHASNWQEIMTGDPITTVIDQADSLAAINYTGGTTGIPKGCMHTQWHMVHSTFSSLTVRGLSGKVSTLTHVPLFWILGENTGILWPILSGGTSVLLLRWRTGDALRGIARHRVRAMHSTAANYMELAEAGASSGDGISSLSAPCVIVHSGAFDGSTQSRWKAAAGADSALRYGGYGSTETHGVGVCSSADFMTSDSRIDSSRIGLTAPEFDVVVEDLATGELARPGEPGRVFVRGPSVMSGFFRDDSSTASVLSDGWLDTGDIGLFDRQGFFYLSGRIKELIKVNGMSVYAHELEEVIREVSGVLDVAVVARDDGNGERVHAFVEGTLEDGSSSLTSDHVIREISKELAKYKLPDVHIVSRLPRTATGKIDKAKLSRPTNRLPG